MHEERRRHPRVTVVAADLRVTKVQPYASAALVDLSLGGMKLEVHGAEPAVGAMLDITINWPKGDAAIQAVVRHVSAGADGFFVGVEFVEPEVVVDFVSEWIRRASGDEEITPAR